MEYVELSSANYLASRMRNHVSHMTSSAQRNGPRSKAPYVCTVCSIAGCLEDACSGSLLEYPTMPFPGDTQTNRQLTHPCRLPRIARYNSCLKVRKSGFLAQVWIANSTAPRIFLRRRFRHLILSLLTYELFSAVQRTTPTPTPVHLAALETTLSKSSFCGLIFTNPAKETKHKVALDTVSNGFHLLWCWWSWCRPKVA